MPEHKKGGGGNSHQRALQKSLTAPCADPKTKLPKHFAASLTSVGTYLISWVAVWAIVGTLLLGLWQLLLANNQFVSADIVFGIAALIVGAKTYFWIKGQDKLKQQKRMEWGIVFVFLILLVFAEVGWVYRKSMQSGTIRASPLPGLFVTDRSIALVWDELNSRNGLVLTPANVVVPMVITNHSNSSIWLGKVSVEYKTGWVWWRPLGALPAAPNMYSFADDRSHARTAHIQGKSIDELSTEELVSGKAYYAYALFQFPRDFDEKAAKFRLKVCDLDDNCSIQHIPTTGRSHSTALLGMTIALGVPDIDLSGIPIVYWTDN